MQPIIGTDLSKNFLIKQVNFNKGIRNKFHIHSIEQVLIVTEGEGIIATEKEEVIVRPGMSYSYRQERNTGMVQLKIQLSHI